METSRSSAGAHGKVVKKHAAATLLNNGLELIDRLKAKPVGQRGFGSGGDEDVFARFKRVWFEVFAELCRDTQVMGNGTLLVLLFINTLQVCVVWAKARGGRVLVRKQCATRQ